MKTVVEVKISNLNNVSDKGMIQGKLRFPINQCITSSINHISKGTSRISQRQGDTVLKIGHLRSIKALPEAF